jgi:aromatic ring-opening dioxygenase catalytic subunit (LigB family)
MQPTFFINHGGGPCFFLEPGPMRDTWRELETYLRGFMATLTEQPQAVLAVAGHWEEGVPTVNAGAHFRGHALGKPISGFCFG